MKNEKIIQKSEFIKSYAGLKRGEENAIAFLNKIIAEITIAIRSINDILPPAPSIHSAFQKKSPVSNVKCPL